ncbi:glycoside hydrolase family 2 protein [Flavobacterium sp. N3904]|uniref:glycoside hydrolase family 2 protein n=1 Tax=Flavobacterium sp. N3904 TaxID=2986835 RepID=UPI0022258FF5|nr:sugar-binding domain-containing protein [Flavobacterium sp. N3904]
MSFFKTNIFLLLMIPVVAFSSNGISLNGSNWHIQQAQFVYDTGERISLPAYDDTNWLKAKVPGTVLEPYINAGIFPDPFFADNMNAIPDSFFSGNDFWYRKNISGFTYKKNKRYFIEFKGINWKSDVYFNGKLLGRIEGAFQRANFEITALINAEGKNALAVLVHHIENWQSGKGKVTHKYLGAPTTNGDISGLDSPAFLAASGWNWLPIVRGRNTGIWNDVILNEYENVSIHDSWISTVLSLPDTTKAALTVRTSLKNHTDQVVTGALKVQFEGVSLVYPITLSPRELKPVEILPSKFKELNIRNPKLWWPNGYGAQNLYNAKISFIQNNTLSDLQEFNFGIRKITSEVKNNILFLYCNGLRILIRGGNWGLPEAMLRCDSVGYNLRVRLHKEANFNMIRNWVGQTGHEDFYKACDKYGILIWDDFWLANPVDGPTPKDTTMFMNNVRDKIKWVRKHPSVALYCGRNEGLPPADLDAAMKEATKAFDGTRLYISESADGLVTGLGPYDVRPVNWYFENRGVTLHSELGIIAFPEVESMRRMLPEDKLWPINDMWAIHDYQWGRSEKFTKIIETRFGEPANVDDYSRRAQLLNYESASAMFECLQSNQGSGVLLWMSQAAWPSMICQLYDHYFEYTASYFAVKKACRPIHILYEPRNNEIRLANNTAKTVKAVRVKAILCDINGIKISEQETTIDIKLGTAITCFKLKPYENKEVHFLKLEAKINNNEIVDNFYWLENNNGSCQDLNTMPMAEVSIKHEIVNKGETVLVKVNIENNTPYVSLLNKLKIKNNKGESVLPVFYSDNYFSLLPGEKKTINLSFENNNDEQTYLLVEGWNNKPIRQKLY